MLHIKKQLVEEQERAGYRLLAQPLVRRQWLELQRKQREFEQRFLSQAHTCSLSAISRLETSLNRLDVEQLNKLLQGSWYNPEVMRAIACVTDTIYFGEPSVTAIPANDRIRLWIHNLHRIGSESVEGIALSGQILSQHDWLTKSQQPLQQAPLQAMHITAPSIVIKAPQNPKSTELLHELVVGWQLNRLRRIVPNYAYVFGGFRCSAPLLDGKKNVVSWCGNSPDGISYVVYENIAPAKQLSELVAQGVSFQTWLPYYMQMLYAGHVAWRELDFTHYDQHDQNVLVRQLSGVTAIPYPTERGLEYLHSNGIATAIDYGFSHVKAWDNTTTPPSVKEVGGFQNLPGNVHPDRSFPLHDAYKLLLFCMWDALQAKQLALFQGMAQLLPFWTDEPAVQFVSSMRSTYYNLPLTPEISALTLHDYTRWIRQQVATPFLSDKPQVEHVLGCAGNDVCIQASTALLSMGLTSSIRPTNVYELYDLAVRVMGPDSTLPTTALTQAVAGFDYSTAITQAREEWTALYTQLTPLLTGIRAPSIARLSTMQLENPQLVNDYRSHITRLAKAYDLIQRLNLLYLATKYTAQYFQDAQQVAILDAQWQQVLRLMPALVGPVSLVRTDAAYISGLRLSTNASAFWTRDLGTFLQLVRWVNNTI